MKAFITGASGFVGCHVAYALHRRGFKIRALVRRGSRVSHLLELNCELVYGDLRSKKDVMAAMKSCVVGFHVAADYRLWVPDPETMYSINVGGTRNVFDAAKVLGLEKLVYTSTVGALGSTLDGSPANEETPVSFSDMVGHYKKSKFLAERLAEKYAEDGLPVLIVNPSTPVGPEDTKPTPTGKIIVDFLNRKIPGYLDTGLNLVDVRDVAEGHILALENGQVGRKYILGNENITLASLFDMLEKIDRSKIFRCKLPYYPVLLGAYINAGISKLFDVEPLIPLDGVRMAKKHMFFDSSRAVNELGLPQTPVEKALEDAVKWFKDNRYINRLR